MKRSFFMTLALYAALFALISSVDFSLPKELPKRVVVSDITIKKRCNCKKCTCKKCPEHPPPPKKSPPKKWQKKIAPLQKIAKPKRSAKPKPKKKKLKKVKKRVVKRHKRAKKILHKKLCRIPKKIAKTSQKTHPAKKEPLAQKVPQNTPAPPAHAQPPTKQPPAPKPSYAKLYAMRFADQIRLAIQKHRYYPRIARRTKKEGVVRVRFVLTPHKEIASMCIVQSSGHKILDRAALKTIKKARRDFPAPKEDVAIVVPIEYRLR